jgi:hypothetical protein
MTMKTTGWTRKDERYSKKEQNALGIKRKALQERTNM